MINIFNFKGKSLIKKVFKALLFIMTFFIFNINSNAAYFDYADFDFDDFAKENRYYWSSECANVDDDPDDCVELVLSRQKQFYTRLYKILAKYQEKGYHIDDNIIIMTVYFGLNPDLFTDDGKNYNEVFGLDNKAYNYDENLDLDNYNIDAEISEDYFSNESDTLDLLIRNMFSYSYGCFAVYGPMQSEYNNETGTYRPYCEKGYPIDVNGKQMCGEKPDGNNIGFWEYVSYRFKIANFFGIQSQNEQKCKAMISDYPGSEMHYVVNNKKVYSVDNYWNFLENSYYFDLKPHLSQYYINVLQATKKEKMSDLTKAEYEEYEEDILDTRRTIIGYIKEILAEREDKKINYDLMPVGSSLYWWPIGSSEVVTGPEGKSYATGQPAPHTITSEYDVTRTIFGVTAKHRGIDLAGGGPGDLNIIAVRSGIVITVVNNCTSGGNKDCGGGYGNYIVISHGDGNFTLYAHLHENTITVREGEAVEQGQVIGKMGNSGRSTGTHLHFEVRVGSNSRNATADPTQFIKENDYRPTYSVVNYAEGNSNKETVCKTLSTSNFSKNAIIALMVNAYAESSFNPTAVGDSGDSYGLFQWNRSRKDALIRTFPGEYMKIDNQITFLISELENGYYNLYKSLLSNEETAYNLANEFCVKFEKPADTIRTCKNRSDRLTNQMTTYVNAGCS